MKVPAKWTDDCQGKKDYDGNIVSVSTRYWPEKDFRPIGGLLVKPSAACAININFDEDDYLQLAHKEFEGESFDEIKEKVETWAQEQMDKVVAVLKAAYQ